MTDKERLCFLLSEIAHENCFGSIEKIANHLIDNGVTLNTVPINEFIPLATVEDKTIPILHISRGQSRFRQMENDTVGVALIVYLSDKAVEPGTHPYKELWNNQSVIPVFGIHIETAAQAHVWAKQFEDLAKSLESKEATNGQS